MFIGAIAYNSGMIFKINSYELGDEKVFALIHKESLQVGLLANLSISTLQIYYLRLAKQKNVEILVARKQEGDVIGFCVIQIGNYSFRSFLSIKILLNLLFCIVSKPRFFQVIINQKKFIKNGEINNAEILIFCVKERYRGAGVGNSLINSAVEFCNDNNLNKIYTTTHNDRLTDFYIKNYSGEIISKTNFGFYQASKVKIR
jgi:ribosomal protein S18 acetylase RimI-like enzyme